VRPTAPFNQLSVSLSVSDPDGYSLTVKHKVGLDGAWDTLYRDYESLSYYMDYRVLSSYESWAAARVVWFAVWDDVGEKNLNDVSLTILLPPSAYPPTVAVLSPAVHRFESWEPSLAQLFALQINNEDRRPVAVDYRVADSHAWQGALPATPGATYALIIPPDAFEGFLAPGQDHTISVRVSNSDHAVTAAIQYRINSPPTAALASPTTALSFAASGPSTTQQLSVNITDRDNDALSLHYRIDAGEWRTCTTDAHPPVAVCAIEPAAFASYLSPGSHSITICARDDLEDSEVVTVNYAVGGG
jgi:hypothetical protein